MCFPRCEIVGSLAQRSHCFPPDITKENNILYKTHLMHLRAEPVKLYVPFSPHAVSNVIVGNNPAEPICNLVPGTFAARRIPAGSFCSVVAYLRLSNLGFTVPVLVVNDRT